MNYVAALLAAAGVGFGHAILPDHWAPLAVLGRTRRYPVGRVARLSALAALAHVAVSLILGAVLIIIGLQFRSAVEHAQDAVVGGLLILTGGGLALLELTGHGHSHSHVDGGHSHGGEADSHTHSHAGVAHPHPGVAHAQPSVAHAHPGVADSHTGGDHPHSGDAQDHAPAHGHDHPHASRPRRLLAVMVPFGAAASPDLTILPVFLAAAAAGTLTAVVALIAFATATIATMVGLTVFATLGGYRIEAPWLDRWGNLFTAAVLIVIGVLVATGVL